MQPVHGDPKQNRKLVIMGIMATTVVMCSNGRTSNSSNKTDLPLQTDGTWKRPARKRLSRGNGGGYTESACKRFEQMAFHEKQGLSGPSCPFENSTCEWTQNVLCNRPSQGSAVKVQSYAHASWSPDALY